jgi:hypothetical protein
MSEAGFAATTGIGFAAGGVDGDVPEAGAGRDNLRREAIKRAAVVGVTTAVLEAAKIRVVHQADVTELGALDDDNVVFVEVLALVDKFHDVSEKAFSAKSKR